MTKISIARDEVRVGRWFSISFQRTLRIPDDGREYPLPPSLGRFPVIRASKDAARLPAGWNHSHSFLLPIYQREALWLAFGGYDWHPCGVRVAVGGVDALTGGSLDEPLSSSPQNYLVTPHQPWLDGIKSEQGVVRQFVAIPLGSGHTVEEQVLGSGHRGGLQIWVHEAVPGRFPERPPRQPPVIGPGIIRPRASAGFGIATGGRMQQKIYHDPYGPETWSVAPAAKLEIHLLNSRLFQKVTGKPPPPTLIDASTYTARGFPWFDLYEEDMQDIQSTARLGRVKSLCESEGTGPEASVEIQPANIRKIRLRRTKKS